MKMPIVHIELIEGRSQAAIKKMVQDVTTAVATNTGAPAEHVHVVVNEMAKERYAVGGVLKSDEN